MTQAASSRPPPPFDFILFFIPERFGSARFPPHIGSAGLFCPQNSAEICCRLNQMAVFTEWSVTPVPHHMTLASPGAPPPYTHSFPPASSFVHAKTEALLLGGSTPVASQVPEEKQIFIFSQSNSCLVRVF